MVAGVVDLDDFGILDGADLVKGLAGCADGADGHELIEAVADLLRSRADHEL